MGGDIKSELFRPLVYELKSTPPAWAGTYGSHL